MRTHALATLTVLGAVLLMVLPASADGVMIPMPPRDAPQPVQYLTVRNHHVQIDVKDQMLVCTIDQVFHNGNPYDVEGEYLFPVPAGAVLSRLTMEVDGKPIEGKMLPRDEARGIYESIVRSMRDPALLEYVGRDTFRARIFPIPANGDKHVVIRYEQVVPVDAGLAEIVYPLNTEKFSNKPLEEVSVSARIRSATPIASVYSPTHDVDVTRVSDREVLAGWEARNIRPDQDFLLYYALSSKDLGVHVISTRADGDSEGYFLLLAAPSYAQDDGRHIPKEVVFVLDTSGSMQEDDKIGQAKAALKFCVGALRDDDWLNVVRFATGVETLSTGIQRADEARSSALAFVQDIEARGGTNLEGALRKAFESFGSGRRSEPVGPRIVVVLTDGNPTVGETDVEELLKLARQANQVGARLFVFGVGYDVNIHFLDRLAAEQNGLPTYVRPGQNIEVPVSSFFSKLSRPALSGIELDFGGVAVKDMYPQKVPDLFHGSQLVVAGRYSGSGSATVTVRGATGDGQYADEFPIHFAEGVENDFVPRIWAARKIGFLLDQVRLHGQDKELVEEIVALSVKFGIMTEYTSFLVEEGARVLPGVAGGGPGMPAPAAQKAGGMMGRGAQDLAGGWAMSQSINAQRLQQQGTAYDNTYVDAEGNTQRIGGVKYVAGRAFYNRNGRWEDAEYREGQTLVQVRNFSAAQFRLAEAAPILNQYMALGDRVVIVVGDQAIEIGADGLSELTDEEVRGLLGSLFGRTHAPEKHKAASLDGAQFAGLASAPLDRQQIDLAGAPLGLVVVAVGFLTVARRRLGR